ncbi:hypothetical protein GALL_486300 [mine drainage metagenome]|uniref:Uncharacterized protein n=1 Tax=mine drainage metagenome TaxID=410659 RepID=A0A1J5Q1L6_9ZZZZ
MSAPSDATCDRNAAGSSSWSRVNAWAAVPIVVRPYRRPASRFDVPANPATTAARAAATAAPSCVRRAPISRHGRPTAAPVIREAADAIAESWLRIDRATVSRSTASAKVPSTTMTGDPGKNASPSAYPTTDPVNR